MNSNGDASLAKILHDKRDTSKWLFDCPGCYGKFETKKDLVAHQQRKLFKCPFKCPQKYTHKWDLVEHQKICRGRILNGNFDNYKIYQIIDVRQTPRSRASYLPTAVDQWVKYPYWGESNK